MLLTDSNSPLEVPLSTSAVSASDHKKFINEKDTNVLLKLSKEYYNLADAFSKEQSKKLPPYRPSIDYKIELKPRAEPPFKKLYPLS